MRGTARNQGRTRAEPSRKANTWHRVWPSLFKGFKGALQSWCVAPSQHGWGIPAPVGKGTPQGGVGCVLSSHISFPAFLQQLQWGWLVAEEVLQSMCLLYTFTISFLSFSTFHPLHSHLLEYCEKQNELEENSSKTGCGFGQILATILAGWEVWGDGSRPVFVRTINQSKRKSSLSVIPEGTDVETPGRKMKLGTHIFTRMSVEKNRLQQHCKREHWGHMGPDLIQSHVRWQILYKPLGQLGDKWDCDGTPRGYPWAEKMMSNWMGI